MRLTTAITLKLQTSISLDLEKPILSKVWSASNGEENIWGFYLCGNEVMWGYYALFDRDTGEYSHGHTLFERTSLHKCLQNVCTGEAQAGCAKSANGRASVKFWSDTRGGFFMRVYDSDGDSLSWNLEPLTHEELLRALQALE